MHIITREIGIDAAHRVPLDTSKCKHLHGHRYRIIFHVTRSELVSEGAEKGMVKNFSFLKDVMMRQIDAQFDHGLILTMEDPMLDILVPAIAEDIRRLMDSNNRRYWSQTVYNKGVPIRLITMREHPTAENLAGLFYNICRKDIEEQGAKLFRVDVYETPNCMATFMEV